MAMVEILFHQCGKGRSICSVFVLQSGLCIVLCSNSGTVEALNLLDPAESIDRNMDIQFSEVSTPSMLSYMERVHRSRFCERAIRE
jgi:hypothetical protein